MASHAGNVSLIGNSSSYHSSYSDQASSFIFEGCSENRPLDCICVLETQETLFQDLYQPECVLEVC